MTTQFPQRIRTVTLGQAVEACSNLAQTVYRDLALSGVQALSIEQALYSGLYQVLLKMNTEARALEYVERRHVSVSAELDKVQSCGPDLFDPADSVEAYCMAADLETAREAGLL